MVYTVEELDNSLEEKIRGLGLDDEFLDNPAFKEIVRDIKNRIKQEEKLEDVTVREKDGNISFEYEKENSEKHSMSISSSNPNELVYRDDISSSHSKTGGGEIHMKTISEVTAKRSENGTITVGEVFAMVDDNECSYKECNVNESSTLKTFNTNGIMVRLEKKSYERSHNSNIGIDCDILPAIAPFATRGIDNSTDNNYSTREYLERDKLDVARMAYDDKKTGVKYLTYIPLYGASDSLQLMSMPRLDPYMVSWEIPRMSTDNIEELLSKETDPKIAEGLRQYSEGREDFYYNTELDKQFSKESTNSYGRTM